MHHAAAAAPPPDAVTADGSPVAVYLALPARDEPLVISRAVGEGASILELGCGVGRVTRVLLALGHTVVAVDEDPAMLAHVTGAERVQGDVTDLDLGRTFDAVVAGSHLINNPDPAWRLGLLRTCARHVAPGGRVLVERHPPGWVASAATGREGPVEIRLRPEGEEQGGVPRAAVTYVLEGREWTQAFAYEVLDDAQLAAEAAEADLVLDEVLTADRTWVALRPAG